jgi:hypothetical protein
VNIRLQNVSDTMARVQRICRVGVLAGCVIASCAGPAGADSIAVDLGNSSDFAALGQTGRVSLYAFSKQGPPGLSGPNANVTTELTSNGMQMPPPAAQTLTGASNNIIVKDKAGKNQLYGPPVVALRDQFKSLMKMNKDHEIVGSRSGTVYSGSAAQAILDGKRTIGAIAFADASAGPLPGGRAAAAAFDPFMVPAGPSYAYAPTIGVTLQLTDPRGVGGATFYALDSSVFTADAVSNFVEDGSPFDQTLWTLAIAANGSLLSSSDVGVDFQLSPQALDELLLPSSYLSGLPGFSASLTNAEIATLIDDDIDKRIEQALALQGGEIVLENFSLFPDGTRFQPTGGDVIYAEGANAALTVVPWPATGGLVLIGLIAAATVQGGARLVVDSLRHKKLSVTLVEGTEWAWTNPS